ncbi:MAG: 4-hydroxythreonine-4-phosphate dehydrogenase PdxA [Burkholderiales bacterium]|nr:4-hydroxythreonine-4-phosphate dehydrogenase PdxA [Burkholderiales bacterium]
MLGDATGIGPEISAKFLASGAAQQAARTVVVGDARVLELGMRDAGVRLPYTAYASIEEVTWPRKDLPLVDLKNIDPAQIGRGEMSAESGRLTGDTLKFMIDLALAGKLDGICFAPLNKGALHAGGWKFHDEHQMFAHLTGHSGFFGEMNVIKEFSTFRVTSHVALRKAVDMITPERIGQALALADETLRAAGCAAPRIGVAALNPHNGENGLFGDEEIRIIAPAIAAARAEGIAASGPYAPDTVFMRARHAPPAHPGEFDIVIAMTHDHGLIPVKYLGVEQGVNVTLGLPFVRTSPDHGTAFDLAGSGRADASSLAAAVRMARRLVSGSGQSEGPAKLASVGLS